MHVPDFKQDVSIKLAFYISKGLKHCIIKQKTGIQWMNLTLKSKICIKISF